MIKGSVLQEGVAIWKVPTYACMLSRVWLFATLWTVAHQDPLSMAFFQARILEWVVIPFPRGSSQPRDWTWISCVSCIGRLILYHWATWEACKIEKCYVKDNWVVLLKVYYSPCTIFWSLHPLTHSILTIMLWKLCYYYRMGWGK